MKNKKIILLIILAIALIISGFLYVRNREKVYSDITYTKIYSAYIYNGCNEESGYFSITNDVVKIGVSSVNTDKKTFKLNKLEYYLILDYLIHVLDIFNCKNNTSDEIYEFAITVLIEDECNYKVNGISLPYTSDFLSDIFVFMVTGMFYIRTIYPIIFLMYFSLGLLLYFATRKYFNGKDLNLKEQRKYLYSLAKPQLLFLLYSEIVLVLWEIIGTNKNIYWLKLIADRKRWLPYYFYNYGNNMILGFVVVCLEVIILKLVGNKNKRLYFAHGIPSIIMLFIYQYFFERDKICYGYWSGLLKALKYEYIIFYETFPIHPRIFYFTLFFFMGLVVYFVFGFIGNKDWRKNLSWSIVFSAGSATLTAMATYVSQYVMRLLV